MSRVRVYTGNPYLCSLAFWNNVWGHDLHVPTQKKRWRTFFLLFVFLTFFIVLFTRTEVSFFCRCHDAWTAQMKKNVKKKKKSQCISSNQPQFVPLLNKQVESFGGMNHFLGFMRFFVFICTAT